MPRFEPFTAIRYASDADFDAVIAPPYDVLSDDDVIGLERRDPHNIVWIDVPRGADDRYEVAAYRLQDWLAKSVLVTDEQPSFTIYRMDMVDATGLPRTITGVLGGLEVVDEGAGGVLPHERTTKKASTDRLDLTIATAANLSPVWGLSLASGLTAELAAPAEPVGQLTVDGVTHRVERVTDPARVERIRAIIARDDVLIADGHHRYGVSRVYRDKVRKATGRKDTAAEFTLTFINELVDDQLSIEAIHRVYDGIGYDELKADLSSCFTFEPMAERPAPATLRAMVKYGRLVLLNPSGQGEWLVPRPGAFDGVRALDGAWLEHALAGSSAQVTYQHGLDEVLAELKGEGTLARHTAAVLIRPTSLDEIRRTAREGLLMPPKSTFFTPKLRTGLVIRPTERLPR
ncbi:DUF1015 domain-containing protein [Brooklawnia cerclae]|uniref:Uncharacterized protein (DUF1015 family) n=1 Tax=Brooklawnia cerclae TaxID=349934 RepID=A0ABX0SNE4_9ACTN|nr:uncharacterized protein (DUF1015 family) [Brooklawnia cerclae]